MSEQLYSIKESTLTDIGDALRRRHGETRLGTITVEKTIPDIQISKTENATGWDTYEGLLPAVDMIDVIRFPYAHSIKVKMNYQTFNAYQHIYIASGEFDDYSDVDDHAEDYYTGGTLPIQTVEILFKNTDVITFAYHPVTTQEDKRDRFGYYAECTPLDADGNNIAGTKIIIEEEADVKNTYSSDEMAQAIDDIVVGDNLPEEAFVISGDCGYRFANGGWDWFINKYGNKIITQGINNSDNMFRYSQIETLPFEMNFKEGGANTNSIFYRCEKLQTIPSIDFKQTQYQNDSSLFNYCSSVREIGTIKNLYPSNITSLFDGCSNLRYIPEFENLNLDRVRSYSSASSTKMFASCYSLRRIPEDFLKQFYGIWTSYIYAPAYQQFYSCYTLDEIKGINPQTGAMTSNMFSSNALYCHRLKDYMFLVQEDGTPYVAKWKSQVLEFAPYVGYAGNRNNILNYNSGITADKEVKDDESYQRLKNDPDWFTCLEMYSRYNHDSAVNTINTLPDTSAYGTNTIKFRGSSGSATDGGAINTLTEEEIAVATAKGWTVTFV